MIQAKDIKLVPVKDLKPNPKNRNKHPKEQIDRLVKLIEYQGFRNPIVVSKQSGFIAAGHGRMEAAKKLGMDKVPVIYQDFENDEQEHAYQISDNAIQAWATLDLSSINEDIIDMGPDFDLELLGLKNFTVDVADKMVNNTSKELDLDSFDNFQHECPKCGFEWNDNGTT